MPTTRPGQIANSEIQDPISKIAAWDNALSRAGASLLQSYAWGEFKRASGWTPFRTAIQNRLARIAAQVLFRSVPKLPLPISVAYIPRGPVHLSPNATHEEEAIFWRKVHAAARKRGAIFLKVEPNIVPDDNTGGTKAEVDARMAQLGFRPSGRLQPARTIVLDISQGEDALLKAMKPKTRYNLRLAGRRGVAVRHAQDEGDLKAFFALLQTTGERDEFGIHTFPYYQHLWDTFGPAGNNTLLVLLADHPDESERAAGPIAALLALRFGKEAIYMYGASDNRGREHMPNYLLQWEAIRWAHQNGCTIYDFWGIPDLPAEDEGSGAGGSESAGGSGESTAINARSGLRGVYWFKKGFGGTEITYPGAYDYVYNRLLYKLWMRWRGANLG